MQKLKFAKTVGSQDLGFRNELNILFHCKPAVRVTLEVIDDDGMRMAISVHFQLHGTFHLHPLIDGLQWLLCQGDLVNDRSRGDLLLPCFFPIPES